MGLSCQFTTNFTVKLVCRLQIFKNPLAFGEAMLWYGMNFFHFDITIF